MSEVESAVRVASSAGGKIRMVIRDRSGWREYWREGLRLIFWNGGNRNGIRL